MRMFVRMCAVLLLVGAMPDPADAQRRVPDEGLFAAGGDVGFFFPDDAFDTAPIVGGLFEYYPRARIGLRASLMFTNPELDLLADESLRQARLGFDVIYNWERGRWHPFAGGGLGLHFVDRDRNGRSGGDDTDLGLSVLGGAEYFFRRRTSFKLEGRLQFVDEGGLGDPSGFAATFGVKQYF